MWLAPNVAVSIPDRIYREGVLSAKLAEAYSNKTFYSVGLMFEPTSGEPLEATAVSTWQFKPGMTLHTYVLAQGFGISENDSHHRNRGREAHKLPPPTF